MKLFSARNIWSRLKAFAGIALASSNPSSAWNAGSPTQSSNSIWDKLPEVVAHLFKVTRRDADQYAAESQQRLARAQADKVFAGEMEPAFGRDGKVYDYDDGVRPDSTVDSSGQA